MKNNFRRAPGSFRDPESTVFFDGDRVHRRLSEEALRHWRDFRDSNAAAALFGDGALVETKEVENEGQIFLEHARVPLISYPYEWSFGMMKDAAASTLGIVDKLLESGFILKDATPFNIQFTGHKPVFIDIGSIVKYEEASGWVGYAQFLETFLYPLMVASLRNAPFQPLIRGQIDGLPVEFMRSLFGWLDMFKPGVFADVLLRQAIGSRTRHRAQAVESRTKRRVGEVRRSSSSALRVPAESVVKNVRRLGRLVEKFRKNDEDSVWKDYMETRPYSEAGIEQKRNFVENVLKSGHGVVWDLGANTGEFSFAAARHSAQVLAIESDHGAADLIYRGAREKNITNLNVIVDDIVNPSPSMGFALEERKSLFSRSRPDLCLALALIHHLVLTRSVPLDLLIP